MIPITQRLRLRLAWLTHAHVLAKVGKFDAAVKAIRCANDVELQFNTRQLCADYPLEPMSL